MISRRVRVRVQTIRLHLFEKPKRVLRFVTSRHWFPWSLWIIVIVPSIIFLFIHWYTLAKTLGDAFVVQVIAVILAAFIAWLIWERSRSIRAKEEEEAASKGREFLFSQANGLVYDVWTQIFDRLIGDHIPLGEAYEADITAEPPTMRNRLLTYLPDEIFRRGKELQHEAIIYYDRASTLRWLAYSQAVQLRLSKFLEDWDQFMIEWGRLLRELEHPYTSKPKAGVLRIDMCMQKVFLLFRDLSEKLESKNYR